MKGCNVFASVKAHAHIHTQASKQSDNSMYAQTHTHSRMHTHTRTSTHTHARMHPRKHTHTYARTQEGRQPFEVPTAEHLTVRVVNSQIKKAEAKSKFFEVGQLLAPLVHVITVGQNHVYIVRCIRGVFGREMTKFTVCMRGSGQPYT